MHNEFKERGFLLQVKPSDKNTFLSTYSSDLQKNPLLDKANTFSKKINLNFQQLNDLFIPLEKLLQVYIAFIKTGFFAFTKKDMVLKLSSDIYKEYSIKINEELTIDNIIRLYLIYLKAEKARSESEDNKTPIPYYLVGFLGYFIKSDKKRNSTIQNLFDTTNDIFNPLFEYLSKLTNQYKKTYIELNNTEYNMMIKKPIDNIILNKQIDILNDLILTQPLKKFLESLN